MSYSYIENVGEYDGPWENLTGQVVRTDQDTYDNGGFSDIYRGKWKEVTGKVVSPEILAIKVLRGVHRKPLILEQLTRRVKRESKVWHSLVHPNILPFYGICTDIGLSPVLVSPFCKNGSAEAYLSTYKNADRLSMLKGIIEGLNYLHSSDVVHGDLKPANILISDGGIPLICDFGRSLILFQTGFTTEFSSTPRYMAPELILPPTNENETGEEVRCDLKPTKASDVFSFGMVCIYVITGKAPYWYYSQSSTVITVIAKLECPNRRKYPATPLLNQFWPLLEKCWAKEKDRPSTEALLRTIRDY